MQHWLNWGRKEYMFQHLLSTIVLWNFQMIVAMAENCAICVVNSEFAVACGDIRAVARNKF